MTALTLYENFDNVQRAAMALYKSGYFTDAKSEAQAIVKVMAGGELGLPPFAAMAGIHIIQGKPALGANVIATLIKNDPRYNYRVVEHTDAVCRIQFFENGEPCGVSEFTANDARKAGTKNMDKFPKNMLFARALSNGAKWYTPGIFGGAPVYTPDELGADVDENGDIVDAPSYTVSAPAPRQPAARPVPPPVYDEPPFGDDEPQEAQFREAAAHNWQIGQLAAVTGKTAVKVGRVTAINGKLTLTLADKSTMAISPDSDALSVPTGQMIAEFLYDATQGNSRAPSPKQLEKARKDMAQLIPNDLDRADFYQCVYGIDDSEQLTAGQASALIAFGGATEAPWQFWPTAAAEAARVIEAWRVDNGQAALPLD
jgi:hypothetical protein